MKINQIHNSDLHVSQLCLGTWQFNDNTAGTSSYTWDAQDYKVSKEIVDASIESGINFFDTAEAYKNSESVLGRIIEGSYKSRRGDLIIASKVGFSAAVDKPTAYTETDMEDSLNTTLRSLKTDYLDIYQIHWPAVMKDVEGTVKALKRFQSLGKIRYYGVSNFGPKTMEAFYAAGGQPISNQLPYSLLWRAIEYDIIPECAKHNLDILAYSPLAQGLLSGKYENGSQFPEGRRRSRLFDCKSTKLATHTEAGCEQQIFSALNQIKHLLNQLNASQTCHTHQPTADNVNDSCCRGDKHTCHNQGQNTDCKQPLSMVSVSLDWILKNPQIASVIVGASSPLQIKNLVSGLNPEALTQDVKLQLDQITEPVKAAIGNNPDMWFTQTRYS